MNSQRTVALFLLGWLTQPVISVSTAAASSAHNRIEGAQTGNTTDDTAAILALLRGVEAAFSEMDLRRWLSHFHESYLILAPEGVIAPSSESEALRLLQPHVESLRARGYAKSELHRATVKLLSPTTALAAVEWIRRKSNDDELERLGATYAFFKDKPGWRIVMLTVHPPETVLKFE